jgi:hypothetical protein
MSNLSNNTGFARAYSVSDVFACPSGKDNRPNSVAEVLTEYSMLKMAERYGNLYAELLGPRSR